VTNGVPLITFAAVARLLAEHGWRPFPGLQTSKIPAMKGWSGLNAAEWDGADLIAAVSEFQPADLYCCCLAVQAEIAVLDADILDLEHAAIADELARRILGDTPLVRIGLAPKCIRIYRADGVIRSRKLHPLEIFSGSGQFIGFGWHAKAGRPYVWPQASPLIINVDSNVIPAVRQAQLERFTTELFRVVPRHLLPTRQGPVAPVHRPSVSACACSPHFTATGSGLPPSCSTKPVMASTMKRFGLSLHPPPGAAFLKMSSGN